VWGCRGAWWGLRGLFRGAGQQADQRNLCTHDTTQGNTQLRMGSIGRGDSGTLGQLEHKQGLGAQWILAAGEWSADAARRHPVTACPADAVLGWRLALQCRHMIPQQR
jgi:hypothetical protein